jgi:hypothetical protein
LLELEGGLAYPRRSQQSFALRSRRCRLCAPAGFVCQQGKSNGQGNGLFFFWLAWGGSASWREHKQLSVTDKCRDGPVMGMIRRLSPLNSY